jgi:hypothetical protein
MTMQNVNSNLVYVVSLGPQIEGTDMTWRDIVVEHDIYFCPVGGGPGGWPKEPPNYPGFRFDGKLGQIRHVESYTVTESNYAGFEPLKERPISAKSAVGSSSSVRRSSRPKGSGPELSAGTPGSGQPSTSSSPAKRSPRHGTSRTHAAMQWVPEYAESSASASQRRTARVGAISPLP